MKRAFSLTLPLLKAYSLPTSTTRPFDLQLIFFMDENAIDFTLNACPLLPILSTIFDVLESSKHTDEIEIFKLVRRTLGAWATQLG